MRNDVNFYYVDKFINYLKVQSDVYYYFLNSDIHPQPKTNNFIISYLENVKTIYDQNLDITKDDVLEQLNYLLQFLKISKHPTDEIILMLASVIRNIKIDKFILDDEE